MAKYAATPILVSMLIPASMPAFRTFHATMWACLWLAVLGLLPAMAQTAVPQTAMQRDSPLQAGAQLQVGDYFHLQKKIYRWNDKTKFVLVHISTASYLPDWQPWNVQLVKDAFAEWQHALDNRLMFVFVNDPSQADVIVQWWNTATPEVEKGACGLNKLLTWGKYIAKNDIYISLHDAAGQPWPPSQLYSATLHEIGHMIGIHTHSDNPNDIMYYTVTQQTHVTPRDINTMRKVYAAKADYTNPPGYHLSHFEDFQKTQKNKSFWIPIFIPIPL